MSLSNLVDCYLNVAIVNKDLLIVQALIMLISVWYINKPFKTFILIDIGKSGVCLIMQSKINLTLLQYEMNI